MNKYSLALFISISFGITASFAQSIDSLFSLFLSPNTSIQQKISLGKNRLEPIYDRLTDEDKTFYNLYMGSFYQQIGVYDSALYNFKQVYKLAYTTSNQSDMAVANNNIGLVFWGAGLLDSALFYLQRSSIVFDTLNLQSEYLQCKLNEAIILYEMGQFELSNTITHHILPSFRSSLRLNELSSAYTNLGLIQFAMSNYHESIQYHKQALQIANKLDADIRKGGALNNITLSNIRLMQLDSANHYSKLAVRINRKTSSLRQLLRCYLHRAELYGLLGKDSSIVFFKMSKQLAQKSGDLNGLCETNFLLCKDFISKERRDSALIYGLNSIEIAKKVGNRKILMKSQQAVLDLRLSFIKDTSLLILFNDYLANEQSLFEYEKLRLISNAETKYQTEQKQQQITLLQKEQALQKEQLKRRNQIMISGGIGSGLLLLLALSVIRNQKQKQKAQKALLKQKEQFFELEKEQLEQQQRVLAIEQQVKTQEEERERVAKELHDNITPLLAVALNKVNVDQNELKEDLTYLNESVRSLSHQLIPIAFKELNLEEALVNFLSAIDGKNGLEVNLNLPEKGFGKLTQLQQTHIYRIVQELAQNIVKHANATNCLFNFVKTDGYLNITITDNGKNFNQSKQNNGLGITSVKNRISDLNGEFSISPKLGVGTKVEMKLPLNQG